MVKVNFSDVKDFQQLPKGKYHFLVEEGEVQETSDTSKHPGVDYWRLTLTVQDGEYQGQHEWVSVMLPPYELFTLFGILRATIGQHEWTEEELRAGDVDVELDNLIGLEFVASVKPQKDNPDFNNVGSFRAYDPDAWADSDLLP